MSPVKPAESQLDCQASIIRKRFTAYVLVFLKQGKLSPAVAELEAARATVIYARNKGCSWGAVRLALQECPAILEQLPAGDGIIDSLPLGLPGYAVLPGREVIRQGVIQEPISAQPTIAVAERGGRTMGMVKPNTEAAQTGLDLWQV